MSSEYKGVTDNFGRRIPGLWERNGLCYMQLRVKQPDGQMKPRRILLESTTTAACLVEMERKRQIRDSGSAAAEPLSIPSFGTCCDQYLELHESMKHAVKRKSTIVRERLCLAKWRTHFGHIRLNAIVAPMIHAFRQKRLRSGRSPRTVNIDVITLRQVLKYAQELGYLKDLPTTGIKPLRHKPPVRPLLKDDQFTILCQKADASSNRSGPILADFIRFLGYSGGRYREALRLKWKDVSFDHRQVTFGSDGLSKNGKARVVDFNPALEAHLRTMHARRAPDCKYLFPSPQRGSKDIPASDLRGSLFTARKEADLEWVGFHDLRHFFASYCVMSGLDFKTIAEWLGHDSGTGLIDKVYGHLAADHKRRMAQKVSFSLAEQASNVTAPAVGLSAVPSVASQPAFPAAPQPAGPPHPAQCVKSPVQQTLPVESTLRSVDFASSAELAS